MYKERERESVWVTIGKMKTSSRLLPRVFVVFLFLHCHYVWSLRAPHFFFPFRVSTLISRPLLFVHFYFQLFPLPSFSLSSGTGCGRAHILNKNLDACTSIPMHIYPDVGFDWFITMTVYHQVTQRKTLLLCPWDWCKIWRDLSYWKVLAEKGHSGKLIYHPRAHFILPLWSCGCGI